MLKGSGHIIKIVMKLCCTCQPGAGKGYYRSTGPQRSNSVWKAADPPSGCSCCGCSVDAASCLRAEGKKGECAGWVVSLTVPVAVGLRLIVHMSVVAGRLLPTILPAAFADLCRAALSAAEQLRRHTEMLDWMMPSYGKQPGLLNQAGSVVDPSSPSTWSSGSLVYGTASLNISGRCGFDPLRLQSACEFRRARLCMSDHFCCKGSLALAQASNKKGLLSSPGSFRVDLFTSPLS